MFKKILLSVAFGAAALGTVPAMAAAPTPTPEEQVFIKKLSDFQACLMPTAQALQKKIESGVVPMMEARIKAANDAMIAAAKAQGMTEDQAKKLSQAMDEQTKVAETKILFMLLASGEQDPRITCGKKFGIANNDGPTPEFMKKFEELTKKYPEGPPQVPGPT